MIVCLCHAVRERELRNAIREGACSVHAIGRVCGAGTSCGSCTVDLRRLLSEEREQDMVRAVAAK